MSHIVKALSDLRWGSRCDHAPAVHNQKAVRPRYDILQPVFGKQNSRSDVPVDLPHRLQKIRGGNRIQLAGRLVQNQQPRVHGHDRGQVQQLLLPAGELRHIAHKPVLDSEIGRHLRHPQTDGRRVAPQAFQPEGKLMPDLVRHNLVVRILQDVADLRALRAVGNLIQRHAAVAYRAAALPVRGKNALALPEQRALSASAFSAEHHKAAFLYCHVYLLQGRSRSLRILEAERFHL